MLIFQILTSGRTGTLRRAHSEELMSEVGVAGNDDGAEINNNTYLDEHSYKGLQVSDRPSDPNNTSSSLGRSSSRRMRRNSAGDEISSILNHETTNPVNGLIVMGSPLTNGGQWGQGTPGDNVNMHYRQFHTRDLASLSPSCCNGEDDELRMAAATAATEQDQLDLSSMTSSSLNTTVITKLEVSDRYVDIDIPKKSQI